MLISAATRTMFRQNDGRAQLTAAGCAREVADQGPVVGPEERRDEKRWEMLQVLLHNVER